MFSMDNAGFSARTLHGCGRTELGGVGGGEGGRCSHLAFSTTAQGGVGVGNKLEELKSPCKAEMTSGEKRG